jgi:ferredoxin
VKISVDEHLCTAYGFCSKVAPQLFQLDELGFNRTPELTPPPDLEERARRAASACPERAIAVVDDD